ncbi:hypothetical protein L6452_24565 [Arctium lappa]|uniref:Uncharacterized protein n=1 Tax=Arctium lappa TaxID=4217 RepID=A0ACB9ABE0_ARCLA|nr:hypothetical protein L6452_24565 [Arctium lappa]
MVISFLRCFCCLFSELFLAVILFSQSIKESTSQVMLKWHGKARPEEDQSVDRTIWLLTVYEHRTCGSTETGFGPD